MPSTFAPSFVQIPPIRTTLLDPSQNNTTAKEWYFYWSQTADKLNDIVTQGTHAKRPAAGDMPNGAIYAESDRSVIYVNEGGKWHYLAGTMWGSVSPDQRPTDLGVNDAGFDFRGTDQQRQFIWSGTAWIEVTPPPQNLLLFANGTTALTLTTVAQPIPGCTLTLTRAGTYLVMGVYDFAESNDASQYLVGALSASTAQALYMTAAVGAGGRATVSQQWIITAAAGATIYLTANKTGGTGASGTGGQHCTISAIWVSP